MVQLMIPPTQTDMIGASANQFTWLQFASKDTLDMLSRWGDDEVSPETTHTFIVGLFDASLDAVGLADRHGTCGARPLLIRPFSGCGRSGVRRARHEIGVIGYDRRALRRDTPVALLENVAALTAHVVTASAPTAGAAVHDAHWMTVCEQLGVHNPGSRRPCCGR